MRFNLVRFSVCSLLLTALFSCAPGNFDPGKHYVEGLNPGRDLKLPPQGVVLFIVDGVDTGIFETMLDAGELPNIQKYFVDRGLYVPKVTAATPSITLPSLTSLVTGQTPGEHGVLGINWFDRNQLIWRNYETIAQKNTLDGDYTAPTIFQHFPERSTYSVFLQPHRGVTKFFENAISNAPAYGAGMWDQMDKTTLSRMGQVAQLARQREEWPAFIAFYLVSPDFHAYKHGVDTDAYRQSLVRLDEQLGITLRMVEDMGMLNDVYIALVSDHGMVSVEQHFPIDRYLRDELGLDVAPQKLWEQTPFESRLKTYRRYNAVVNCSGNRYAAIQLRAPNTQADGTTYDGTFISWPKRPSASTLQNYPTGDGQTVDLPKVLVDQDAIAAVAWRVGPDCIHLLTDDGLAEFRRDDDGMISYMRLEGIAPLGWAGKVEPSLLDGTPADGRTWQEQTAGLDYADIPTQLLTYFEARRAGDLVVFANDGWDFRQSNRAGHGSIRAGELHVPFLLAGPGIEPGRLDTHPRNIDIPITLLHLMGKTDVATPNAAPIMECFPASSGE